ncbi:MAG: ribosome silencing factor [Bacteroidales bacterium]
MKHIPIQDSDTDKLVEAAIEGILNKKGLEVISMDMRELPNAVTDAFVICHATSDIQARAIADAVIDETIKRCKSKPWHREGLQNAEWILLDYVDVVVHIFQEKARRFYNLEDLWADARIRHITDENNGD